MGFGPRLENVFSCLRLFWLADAVKFRTAPEIDVWLYYDPAAFYFSATVFFLIEVQDTSSSLRGGNWFAATVTHHINKDYSSFPD